MPIVEQSIIKGLFWCFWRKGPSGELRKDKREDLLGTMVMYVEKGWGVVRGVRD